MAAEPALAGATIMMLTSSGHYGDRSRCAELGIAAYLTKPMDAGRSARPRSNARLAQSRRRSGAPRLSSANPGTLAMAAGGTRIRVLLAEDNVVNQRVAVGLLTRRGHDVDDRRQRRAKRSRASTTAPSTSC